MKETFVNFVWVISNHHIFKWSNSLLMWLRAHQAEQSGVFGVGITCLHRPSHHQISPAGPNIVPTCYLTYFCKIDT